MIVSGVLLGCFCFSPLRLFGGTFQVKWLGVLVLLAQEEPLSLFRSNLALLRG
jgi:hypothetical protein